MSEETKVCPFCSEDIPFDAVKCPCCKEVLIKEESQPTPNVDVLYKYNGLINIIDSVIKFFKSNALRTTIKVILVLALITCIIWVLGFDYPAVVLNKENFWYGQYLSAGMLHTLLAILFALILLILK